MYVYSIIRSLISSNSSIHTYDVSKGSQKWDIWAEMEQNTKSFNKKDALMKLNFDNLPVVGETKLKKQLKALILI